MNKDKLIVHSNIFFNKSRDFFWGSAHYSYKVVADRFSDFFKRNKILEHKITDPRIYHHPISRSRLKNFVHFTCTAFEDVRPMPDAYNIASVAWEFNEIPKHYLKNLELYDEIWATSNFGRDVIKKNIKNKKIKIKTVQIPLPDSILEFNQKSRTSSPFKKLNYYEYPKLEKFDDSSNESQEKFVRGSYVDPTSFKENSFIFSLFNPWDRRKDFARLIKLFLDKKNIVEETLLIKLSIDNKGTKLHNLPEIIEELGYKNFKKDYQKSNKKIIFCYGQLDDKELFQIYKQAKHLLYISKCEGTNLPLVESLYLNCPAITPVHSGISDFLPKNYMYKIDSYKDYLDNEVLNLYGFETDAKKLPFWNIVKEESFFEALNKFKIDEKKFNNKLNDHFSDQEILRNIYEK